ncbi:MAG: DUF3781 domain-containing protein [Planctomycetaceae bacterium]|nr:DUF3781 domain-containing protein [Planctomycetaceae bacterium]
MVCKYNCVITVNAYSYTIITAHKIKNNGVRSHVI